MGDPITLSLTIDSDDLGPALGLLRKLQADAERRRKRAPNREPVAIDRVMLGAGTVLTDALIRAFERATATPTRWVVCYTRIPTNYNTQQRMIVEAPTADDARELARESIGDRGKQFATYHIESVKPEQPNHAIGHVLHGAR